MTVDVSRKVVHFLVRISVLKLGLVETSDLKSNGIWGFVMSDHGR